MKINIIKAAGIVLVVGVLLTNQSYAHEGEAGEQSSTVSDVSNPGLLPDSRLYFMKEWSRGLRQFFTFNPAKKAELELDVANEKAAELQKLKETKPNNLKAIVRALDNYNKNVVKLKTRLENLKNNSENPNIDRLLEKLADRSVEHQILFNDFRFQFKEKEIKDKLDRAEGDLNDAIFGITKKVKNPEKFVGKLKEDANKKDVRHGVQALKLIDRLEDKLGSGTSSEFRDKISALREDVIKKVENARPEALKKIEASAEEVEKIIVKARETISEVEKKLEVKKLETTFIMPQVLEKQLSNAKMHLEKAVMAKRDNKFGEALGQATASLSNAKNALRALEGVSKLMPPQTVPPKKEPPSASRTSGGQEVKIFGEGEFKPKELHIKKGDKVTWVNIDSARAWPASAVHPTHNVYPEVGGCIGSTFDACKEMAVEETFEFVFNHVGTWKYHNHLNTEKTGVVVVEE